ncbi:hydroxyacylglutathione hydrolase [endosymbiont of Lamellibrachia barhami]|uniref:hydroxyacylglutathione hydrolase n=1 Tax=endosymbiont of Lamellibrachia barhami TaxID=205975 RepID=UPI0015B30EB8|nr:hydroxyacylglutathione hydrolase [endosymbiont of Lamellibrachia barhami]
MFDVTPIPSFNDNYIWLISEPDLSLAVVVDPGETGPVAAYLELASLELGAILVTHHHNDHVGGIPGLLQRFPGIEVFGPAKEPIRGVNRRVTEGDLIELPGMTTRFRVLDTPGHTAGHVSYLGENALFCGDTLFAAGCGRVFDGTHEALAASLVRFAGLPAETQVYCAHEYTLDNLGFAAWVEPQSEAIKLRLLADRASRESGRPTLPSLLASELATNPFLRTGVRDVINAAERYAGKKLTGDEAVFTALRNWKDREYD